MPPRSLRFTPPPQQPSSASSSASTPSSSSSSSSSSSGNIWGPYSNGHDFDTYMVIVVAILVGGSMLAVLILALLRFVCLKQRCPGHVAPERGDAATANAIAAGSGVAEEAEKGGSLCGADLAEALSEVAFEEGECAICLSEFAGGEGVRVMPSCRHGFHLQCIGAWLEAKASCPTCRASCRQCAPDPVTTEVEPGSIEGGGDRRNTAA